MDKNLGLSEGSVETGFIAVPGGRPIRTSVGNVRTPLDFYSRLLTPTVS